MRWSSAFASCSERCRHEVCAPSQPDFVRVNAAVNTPVICQLGDRVLLLRLGDQIDVQCNRDVHALAAMLQEVRPDWLLDIVPAYASLALHVDVDRIVPASMAGTTIDHDPLEVASQWVQTMLAVSIDTPTTDAARVIAIPVRYGGEFGPDLDAVAAHAGLTLQDVIARHTTADYSVAMIGFAPGFPYLLGLDPSLAMPRKATPRTHVPAGSIAIGGLQSGIYPREGPGGWQLIGRTDTLLFDPANGSAPTLLRPGDRLRFVAIDAHDGAAG